MCELNWTYEPTYTPAPPCIPNVYPCIPTPTYMYQWSTAPCNHCWCKNALDKENHVQCCKCLDTMDMRFVPERRAERQLAEVEAIKAWAAGAEVKRSDMEHQEVTPEVTPVTPLSGSGGVTCEHQMPVEDVGRQLNFCCADCQKKMKDMLDQPLMQYS